MLRKYAAELFGTFALVFFGCGARDMVGDTTQFAGILLVHLTFGLTIAAMVYMFGYLSSAHFNPAITFGFALSKRFPWRYVLPYWLAQALGGLLAVSCHALFIPDQAVAAHYGANIPKIGIFAALGVEVVLTFFLMMVSMASATDKRFKRSDSGITVGFTIIVSGLMANSLSGGSIILCAAWLPLFLPVVRPLPIPGSMCSLLFVALLLALLSTNFCAEARSMRNLWLKIFLRLPL